MTSCSVSLTAEGAEVGAAGWAAASSCPRPRTKQAPSPRPPGAPAALRAGGRSAATRPGAGHPLNARLLPETHPHGVALERPGPRSGACWPSLRALCAAGEPRTPRACKATGPSSFGAASWSALKGVLQPGDGHKGPTTCNVGLERGHARLWGAPDPSEPQAFLDDSYRSPAIGTKH